MTPQDSVTERGTGRTIPGFQTKWMEEEHTEMYTGICVYTGAKSRENKKTGKKWKYLCGKKRTGRKIWEEPKLSMGC